MRIFVPIANPGVDPSEVAIPWQVLTRAGHSFELATEDGRTAQPDRLMMEGCLGGLIGARKDGRVCFAALTESEAWRSPVAWSSLRDLSAYDAIFVPGGHMQGMKALVADVELHRLVRGFWQDKPAAPVAAMCHGVVLLAASGVLYNQRTTCFLTAQEALAWAGSWWDWGSYVRVFPRWVTSEVRAGGAVLVPAPWHFFSYGTESDDRPTFVHADGRYLSARWPGDAWRIARELKGLLADPGLTVGVSVGI